MPTLLYIHGFLSSSQSTKAQQCRQWLARNRPDWQFACPDLSSCPQQALQTLLDLIESLSGETFALVGSSLGGYWATVLGERFRCRTVLINPAVEPHRRFKALVGQTLTHYYTGADYILTNQDLAFLQQLSPRVTYPERYWLLVQTGDVTLDYRHAVDFYDGCHQTVVQGGNHAFEHFDRWLPQIVKFLDSPGD